MIQTKPAVWMVRSPQRPGITIAGDYQILQGTGGDAGSLLLNPVFRPIATQTPSSAQQISSAGAGQRYLD
jgi:hypothetical protein